MWEVDGEFRLGIWWVLGGISSCGSFGPHGWVAPVDSDTSDCSHSPPLVCSIEVCESPGVLPMAKKAKKDNGDSGDQSPTPSEDQPVCGLVMPISEIDGCPDSHWREVRGLLEEAARDAGFDPQLVSESREVKVIHTNIVQNLYDAPMVLVDVSGANPNVYLELGLRLAFDKPVVIVRDDKTKFRFDISPIEHLPYPRDLRIGEMREFIANLSEKLIATHKVANKDPEFSQFLAHFKNIVPKSIATEEVGLNQYISRQFEVLSNRIDALLPSRSLDAFQSREAATPYMEVSGEDCVAKLSNLDTELEVFAVATESTEGERFYLHYPYGLPAEKFVELVRAVKATGLEIISLGGES